MKSVGHRHEAIIPNNKTAPVSWICLYESRLDTKSPRERERRGLLRNKSIWTVLEQETVTCRRFDYSTKSGRRFEHAYRNWNVAFAGQFEQAMRGGKPAHATTDNHNTFHRDEEGRQQVSEHMCERAP